ncbi:MAG: hypothetical protein ABIR94_06330 [Rubrivivax sp.]
MTTEELAVLVRNLPQAQTLDLYRLEHAIRALYCEPKRVLAIRVHLRLGMRIRFFGRNTGAFHSGRIVAMNDHGMTIDEQALNLRHSNVPYAAIDLETAPHSEVEVIDAEPVRPAPITPARAQFKPGDRVIFNDRNQIPITGTVTRINQKTVTVVPDNRDGHWRVAPALLNHLVDI